MIKKDIKKWYPTKELENKAKFDSMFNTITRISNELFNRSYGNWVIVGPEVAQQLERIQTSPATINSGSTFFSGTTMSSGSTYTSFLQ